jgi:carbohydrate kinase (thermoresistant glucokinase family)
MHDHAHPSPSPSILLIMGVSGCGKTTTAQRLAKQLGWTFRDGDTFHPEKNVAKMKDGTPLTDDDRWPWLDAIGAWIDEHRLSDKKAIVTCSALKRSYRQRLLHNRPGVQLIYLKGSKGLIGDRISRRRNHFMPTSLLDSQFATLEEPLGHERPIVVNVAMPPNRVVERILVLTRLAPPRDAGVGSHRDPGGTSG